MNKATKLFYKITNIKPYRSYKIKDGITNINYKIFTDKGVFVMRIPRKDIVGIDFKRQDKVLTHILQYLCFIGFHWS